MFDFGVANKRAKTQFAVAALNNVEARNEIDVDEGRGPRQAHLHERNQALATGEEPRILTKLLEELYGFFQSGGAMIRKRMCVHGCVRSSLLRDGAAHACRSKTGAQRRRHSIWNDLGRQGKRDFRIRMERARGVILADGWSFLRCRLCCRVLRDETS